MKSQNRFTRLCSSDATACARRVWDVCRHYSVHSPLCDGVGARCTVFHSSAVPSIDLDRYWMSLWQRTQYGRPCLSMALVLLARYWSRTGHHPSQLTAHRLLASALLVASKLHQDEVYANATFASMCGIPLMELNRLEVAFLQALDFESHVSSVDIERVVGALLDGTCVSDYCAALGVADPEACRSVLSLMMDDIHSSTDSTYLDATAVFSPEQRAVCGAAAGAAVAIRFARRVGSLE